MPNKYVIEFDKEEPWPRLMSGIYDEFFKTASLPDIADETDGNVEAPCGFISHIIMDEDSQGVYDAVAEYLDRDVVDFPEPGVYVTSINNSGLIFAWEFETRETALAFYNSQVEVYSKWDSEENPDD